MNITVQQFNDVVTGANTHRQLLQAQVNEKIEVVRNLQSAVSGLAESNKRAVDFIKLATSIARGEGGDTALVDFPGGAQLISEIMLLRQAASTAIQALEQERAQAKSRKRRS